MARAVGIPHRNMGLPPDHRTCSSLIHWVNMIIGCVNEKIIIHDVSDLRTDGPMAVLDELLKLDYQPRTRSKATPKERLFSFVEDSFKPIVLGRPLVHFHLLWSPGYSDDVAGEWYKFLLLLLVAAVQGVSREFFIIPAARLAPGHQLILRGLIIVVLTGDDQPIVNYADALCCPEEIFFQDKMENFWNDLLMNPKQFSQPLPGLEHSNPLDAAWRAAGQRHGASACLYLAGDMQMRSTTAAPGLMNDGCDMCPWCRANHSCVFMNDEDYPIPRGEIRVKVEPKEEEEESRQAEEVPSHIPWISQNPDHQLKLLRLSADLCYDLRAFQLLMNYHSLRSEQNVVVSQPAQSAEGSPRRQTPEREEQGSDNSWEDVFRCECGRPSLYHQTDSLRQTFMSKMSAALCKGVQQLEHLLTLVTFGAAGVDMEDNSDHA